MLSQQIYSFFAGAMISVPGNFLEIGVYDGDGIAMLSRNYPDRMFFGIDPFIEDGYTGFYTGKNCGDSIESIREKAHKNCAESGVVLYDMTTKEFMEGADDFAIDSMEITMISVDGSHKYEDILIDIQLVDHIFKNQVGIVHFDDLHIEDVRSAVSIFKQMHQDMVEIKTAVNMCAFVHKGFFSNEN